MHAPFYTPYLVQRGKIRRIARDKIVYAAETSQRLSHAIDFDYMGSAEYEFGALGTSFRALEQKADKIRLSHIKAIKSGGTELRVLRTFDDEVFELYTQCLLRLRGLEKPEIRTKEWTDFHEASARFTIPLKTNFWWAIQNHVMWSFDSVFMEQRLRHHLEASWETMNFRKD